MKQFGDKRRGRLASHDGTRGSKNLKRFMGRHGLASLIELQLRSTNDLVWFGNLFLAELDIRFENPM